MHAQPYTCSITVPVPITEAFAAIGHVADWWAKVFEGRAEALDDVFTVRFGETFVTFRITEIIPDQKAVWHVTDCFLPWLKDKTEWTGTEAIWKLAASPGGTRIDFTHAGLVPQVECYGVCVKGWDQHIKDSLYKLLTTGKGSPT
ncbi:MAG: SRPBCC domain-containing protein [Gammaproteobacteria bacterium]|nr:SRPBCC domain-containing protein [Gammaproteobacteria bacterium]